jgi:hypothetical protein
LSSWRRGDRIIIIILIGPSIGPSLLGTRTAGGRALTLKASLLEDLTTLGRTLTLKASLLDLLGRALTLEASLLDLAERASGCYYCPHPRREQWVTMASSW